MPLSDETHKFLGLTKSQFFYALVVYVLAATCYFTVTSIQRDAKLQRALDRAEIAAKLGVEAHTANCALKDDLEKRIKQGQEDLARAKAAFEKNPNLLPNVPKSLIQAGWDSQQRGIDGQTRTVILLDKALSCGKEE